MVQFVLFYIEVNCICVYVDIVYQTVMLLRLQSVFPWRGGGGGGGGGELIITAISGTCYELSFQRATTCVDWA